MILMSPRLVMEKPKPVEANQFSVWLNNPEIVRYSEQRHKKHTPQTQTDHWLSPATIEPNMVYSIYLQENEGLIGSISAQVDPHNNVANVGILIGDKSQWGKGYGYEAWECFCNYLFYEKKIRKIEAGCMETNFPMKRICQKFMMFYEGARRGHFLLDGITTGLEMYGKLR